MFTNIDSELYPDLCEVAEMPLHGQWVYLIQKNGTSSIRQDPTSHSRILVNDQITELDFVDVYVRDPKTRYLSGINTFVQHLTRAHPELDRHTLLWMASRYLFLNRHYLPQILWIVNLTRYLRRDTTMRFHDFQDFNQVVNINHDAEVIPMSEQEKEFVLSLSPGLELWVFADQILRDLSGKSMSWNQLKRHYRANHTNTWNTIVKTAQTFQHVLS